IPQGVLHWHGTVKGGPGYSAAASVTMGLSGASLNGMGVLWGALAPTFGLLGFAGKIPLDVGELSGAVNGASVSFTLTSGVDSMTFQGQQNGAALAGTWTASDPSFPGGTFV